jgi:hypothetical protein
VKRDEFVDWLETLLNQQGSEVGRWQVDPGLEDLQIQGAGGKRAVRLRIVRGSPNTGEVPAGQPPVVRPAGTSIQRV